MKKIISLLLVLTAISSLFISYSEAKTSNSFSEDINFLKALDIVVSEEDITSGTELRTGEFINMVLNIMDDNKFSGNEITEKAEQLAVGYGLIESLKTTDISSAITYKQAVTMLTKAVGYRVFSNEKDYMVQASDIGLLDGAVMGEDDKLIAGIAAKLLVNACDVEAVVANIPYHNSKMEYNLSSDVTLLEYARGIYKKKGTVTGNEYTTIYIPEGIGYGRIQIDSVTYLCDNSDYNDYIGQEVVYYLYEGDRETDETVKYVKPTGKMDITRIDANDFEEISGDFSKITYNENNRSKTIKISAAPKVIYNGKVYGGYTVSDFELDAGYISVMKSSQPNVTDVVVIESYEAMIADRISKEYKKIYNKFNYTDATESISLKENDYVIFKNGEKTEYTDIKEWDVLSVAHSKSGSKACIKILISDFKEETKTENISYIENEVTAIGYIYNISDSYLKNVVEGVKVGEELKSGEYQIYLLDVFENIVAVTKDYTKVDNVYVYLTKVYRNDSEDICSIKYFDIGKEEWVVSDLYQKVKINTQTMKSAEDVMNNQSIFDAEGKTTRQLVKIRFNARGEINRIETAEFSDEANQKKFTKKQATSITFWTENSSFKGEIFPTESGKILCVPTVAGEPEDYYITNISGFATDAASALATSVTAYDFDEFSRSDMIVVTYGKETVITDDEMARSISSLFVVTGIEQAIGSDDEIRTQLIGSMGNFEDLAVIARDESVVSDVKVGDVLQLKIDSTGKLMQKRTAFSPTEAKNSRDVYNFAKSSYNKYFMQNARGEVTAGWVKDINLGIGQNQNMVLLDSEKTIPVKLNGSVTSAIIYDCESKHAINGSLEDIEVGDLMVVRLQYSVVKAIVIIKNLK